jgi:hypothetical protein
MQTEGAPYRKSKALDVGVQLLELGARLVEHGL